MPMSAASSPIGPAPVTSTRSCTEHARVAMRSICSHALARMLDGSVSTPRSPSSSGIGIAKSCSIGHELGAVAVEALDAALGVLAVAAHVPLALAQQAHGTGSGRRTMPDHELARLEPRPGPASRGRAARGRARAARDRAAARRERRSAISRSVPQTPSRTGSTSSSPSFGSGSGSSVSSALSGTPGNDRHRAHQRGKFFTTESRQSVMMSWKPVGRRTSRQMPARRYRAISLPSWRAWMSNPNGRGRGWSAPARVSTSMPKRASMPSRVRDRQGPSESCCRCSAASPR